MKLYLIRHAESANNAVYAATGGWDGRVPDPEITETGHLQAQALGKLLADDSAEIHKNPHTKQAGFGLTHLYCSLMTRTILTGNYIAEARGMTMTARDNTFEYGGIYEGREQGDNKGLPGPTRDYFTERFPKLILPDSVTSEVGWYNRPHETEAVFLERMNTVVSEIVDQHTGTNDSVALVAHGDFIDQFINVLMGVARRPEVYEGGWEANFGFNNTSISRVDFNGKLPTVVYLNRVDHLSAELMTW